MVLMLLLTRLALAAPVLHASGSIGWQCLPAFRPQLSNTFGTPFARAELGAGVEKLQVYGVVQTAIHQGDWSAVEAGWIRGDTRFTNVGLGARMPVAFGIVRLVPHADVGAAFADAPANSWIQTIDVDGEALGDHTFGLWAQAGADVGIAIVPDRVDIFVAADAGLVLWSAVIDARAGLSARF